MSKLTQEQKQDEIIRIIRELVEEYGSVQNVLSFIQGLDMSIIRHEQKTAFCGLMQRYCEWQERGLG